MFERGIPEEMFNLTIDFNTAALFEPDSAEPLGAEELFDIIASADYTTYILEYVRW